MEIREPNLVPVELENLLPVELAEDETRKKQSAVTEKQIAEWKKAHGEVHRIEVSETPEKFDPYKVPDDEDTAEIPNAVVGYLRRPNDRELNFAQSKMPNFTDAGKVILKACWLGGDERILNDPKLFRSAALQCLELLEVQRTRLKKL